MPESALNTKVDGDTAACRATARWLNELAEAIHEAGRSLYRTRSESEAVWNGRAGDSFRERIAPKAQDTDQMVDRANELGQSLSTFANDLDTVRARMDQARDVAAKAGLTVTPEQIHPPGPGPADVFDEVSITVGEAREREQDAHRALTDVVNRSGFFKQYGLTVATAVASTGAAVQGEVRMLNEKIQRYNKAIKLTTNDVTSATSFSERQAFNDRLMALRKGLYDTEQRALRSKLVSYPLGGPVTKINPGDIEKGAEKLSTAGRVGKAFPGVGTLLTAGTAAKNIHEGKPAAKEVEKAAGGTLASIGTGAAAGACIGGPVGAAVGAVGGAAVSYGLGEFIDWEGGPVEDFNRWIGIE